MNTVKLSIRILCWLLLLLPACIPFGQTSAKPRAQAPKSDTAAPPRAPKQQDSAQKAGDADEVVPVAGPAGLFPALVARVNGKAVSGRDLEQRVQSELASIGNPAWENLREDYRQELTQ